MALVFLKYPVVKHYAGSIFELEEYLDQDDYPPMVYEKQHAKRYYKLPDDGKGKTLKLDYSDTELCPPEIFNEIDLNSGPGRITSIRSGFDNEDQNLLYSWFDSNRVILSASKANDKQVIQIQWPEDLQFPLIGKLYDRKQHHPFGTSTLTKPYFNFDLSNLYPGFFEILIEHNGKLFYRITFIKCFPLVVTDVDSVYRVQRTIW